MRTLRFFGLMGALLGLSAFQQISGTVIYSFSEEHFLIQTPTHVFQIRREGLTEKDTRLLESVGSSVVVNVPRESIDRAWRFASDRKLASLEEEVRDLGDTLLIRGRLLPSMSQTHYMIQAGHRIYMVQQSAISENMHKMDSMIGSQVSFAVPAEKVDMSWASQGAK